MAEQRRILNNGVTVQKHHDLSKVTEEELRQNPQKVLHDADHGIQTAIIAADGRVQAVVGLNGIRYLPDPDPDPLDEILRQALESSPKT